MTDQNNNKAVGERSAGWAMDTLDLPDWAHEYVCGDLLSSPAGIWVMVANNLSMAVGVAEQLTFEASEVSGAEAFVKRRVGRVLLDDSIRQLRASGRQLDIPLAKVAGQAAEVHQASLLRGLLEHGLHADYYIDVSKDMRRMLGPISEQLIEVALPFAGCLIAKLGEASSDPVADKKQVARTGKADVSTDESAIPGSRGAGNEVRLRPDKQTPDSIADRVSFDVEAGTDMPTPAAPPESSLIEYPAFYSLPVRLAFRRAGIEVSTASEQSLISLLSDSADSFDDLVELASFVEEHRLASQDSSRQEARLDDLAALVNAVLANRNIREVPDLLLRRHFDRSWVRLFRQRRERPPAGLLIRVLLRYYTSETYEPGLFVDLGCGSGAAARYMLKGGWRVFACDHRAAAQESITAGLSAREKDRLTFVKSATRSVVLPDNADLIWADRSLPGNSDQLAELLKRIKGSLRPGGFFFVDLSTHQHVSRTLLDSLFDQCHLHDVHRFADNHFARCMARLSPSPQTGQADQSTRFAFQQS